ncbi:hypothetical protein [Halobaculum gomorrense]|uniref:Uncharacterized protein n=1 Tax=Halobaculum gomorrense TaxID=43928 RepID=A0A1M5UEJ9_9EURY|nr:hypothetical protein [Halobaculum gomorrense]SHH61360.1 hypothetical protein SAMN05443636_3002 [Halobaculum gomorrense]
MSREHETAAGRSPAAVVATAVARTRRGLLAALADPVAAAVLVAATAAYALVYAVAVGDLGRAAGGTGTVGGDAGAVSVTVVSAPVTRGLSGEGVALVAVGPVEYLFVPATLAVAVAIGLLVGANLALSALAWRRPAACDISPASGVAAGLPALLSGTACCGPLVFIALGLQATSAALTAIAWLRPAAALLLVASLLWAGWRLDVQSSAADSPGKMLSGM